MYNVIELEQNTKEWLKFRRDKIGASDAAAIMGSSSWSTPWKLWLDKIMEKDIPMNPAMKRGHDLEPIARSAFEQMSGTNVMPVTVQSKEYPWMIASLDGMDFEGSLAVEIKCPGEQDHMIASIEERCPDKYYPQLQHQMYVTGLKEIIYFSFDGATGVMFGVKADDEYQAKLIRAELAFYKGYLEPGLRLKTALKEFNAYV